MASFKWIKVRAWLKSSPNSSLSTSVWLDSFDVEQEKIDKKIEAAKKHLSTSFPDQISHFTVEGIE